MKKPIPAAAALSADNILDVYVGARVRMRRLHLGLSVEELALMAGTSGDAMRAIEEGTQRISASMVLQMSQLLDAPVSWFFEGMGAAGTRDLGGRMKTPATVSGISRETEDLEVLRYSYLAISNPSLRATLVLMAKMLADADLTARAGKPAGAN